MKKYLVLLATVVMVLALFSSCSQGTGDEDGKKVLRFVFWGDIEEIKIINNIVEKFEAAYPGIKVKAERAPAGNPYMEKIMTQIAGKMAPDVVFVSSDNIPVFAKKGLLNDLNPYVKRDKFPIDSFYEVLVDRFIYCLLYTSPSPRDRTRSRMPSSA